MVEGRVICVYVCRLCNSFLLPNKLIFTALQIQRVLKVIVWLTHSQSPWKNSYFAANMLSHDSNTWGAQLNSTQTPARWCGCICSWVHLAKLLASSKLMPIFRMHVWWRYCWLPGQQGWWRSTYERVGAYLCLKLVIVGEFHHVQKKLLVTLARSWGRGNKRGKKMVYFVFN